MLNIIVGALLLLLASGSAANDQVEQEAPSSVSHSTGLPSHNVASNTPLMHGRRIEIHSADPHLTKAECNALINAYRAGAGRGQVSVRKPNKMFNNDLSPWCVENFDGKGVFFQDTGFEFTE